MHARNLATFATIYKLTLLALRNLGPTPGKEGKLTSNKPRVLLVSKG